MRRLSTHQILASLLTLFALITVAISLRELHQDRWGVPNGLTGGRSWVNLENACSISVDGGFVRHVNQAELLIRSTAPYTEVRLENPNEAPRSFTLRLMNVAPDRITLARLRSDGSAGGGREPIAFTSSGVNEIRFTAELPPQSTTTFQLEAVSESDDVRFFVFGAVREGTDTLDRLLSIAGDEKPQFVISLGDVYYRATAENVWGLDERLARAPVPVYLTTGDIERRHPPAEYPDDDATLSRLYPRARFVTLFGPPNSAFTWKGWRFVIFENSSRKVRAGGFGRLENMFEGEKSELQGRILFAHIPPFDPRTSIYKEGLITGSRSDHRKLVELMKRYDVTAAFFSHYRGSATRRVEGIACYVTAAAGAKLPEGVGDPHFLEVTLTSGRCEVRRRAL